MGAGLILFAAIWDVPSRVRVSGHYQALPGEGCSGSCQAEICCSVEVFTRAQAAVALTSALEGEIQLSGEAEGIFRDVPASHWAAPAIEHLYRLGVLEPCGEGLFCPDAPVSRGELPQMVLKARFGGSYRPLAAEGLFKDLGAGDARAPWAEQLFIDGAIEGCGGGNFCPGDGALESTALQAIDVAFGVEPCAACVQ